jgi:DNA-binding MarR family transcriptional regulator
MVSPARLLWKTRAKRIVAGIRALSRIVCGLPGCRGVYEGVAMTRGENDPEHADPGVRASMDALRRIVRALRLSATDVQRDLGITVAQLFVLRQLSDGRPRSINELAEQTITDPSTISGLIRRLLDTGLVRRGTSPSDARRAEVSLTPKGTALLRRAPAAPQSQLVAALTAMSPKRLSTLAAGLAELAARLGAAEPPSLFFEDEPTKRPRRRA